MSAPSPSLLVQPPPVEPVPARVRLAMRTIGTVTPGGAAWIARRLFSHPRRLPPRAWEIAVLADAKPLTPAIPGIAAVEWGPVDGPLVLMLHGWEGRGSQLGAFAAPLAARGFHVVTLDAPGHGGSDGKESSPLAFAATLRRATELLGPAHAVLGHSLGGASMIIAMNQGLSVPRPVMLGSPTRLSRAVRVFPQLLGLPPRAAQAFLGIAEREIGAPIERWDPLHIAPTLARRAGITAPLVVHTPDDDHVPLADATDFVAAWPGARLLEAPIGGGHYRFLRDPQVLAEVVRFVTA